MGASAAESRPPPRPTLSVTCRGPTFCLDEAAVIRLLTDIASLAAVGDVLRTVFGSVVSHPVSLLRLTSWSGFASDASVRVGSRDSCSSSCSNPLKK